MKALLLLLLTSCSSPGVYQLCNPTFHYAETVAEDRGFVDHQEMIESAGLTPADCSKVSELDKREGT